LTAPDFRTGDVDIVFFDLDGTLLQGKVHFPTVFAKILSEHGLTYGSEDIRAAVRDHWPWYEENVVTLAGDEPAFWSAFNRLICEALGAGPRAAALGQQVTETLATLDRPTLYDDVLPCLDALAAAHLRLGVITARPDARRILAPLSITHRSDPIIDAFTAGSAKQDPTIYAHALRQAAVPAERALHVGDQYTRDVLAARAMGLHAILLDRANQAPEADCSRIQTLAALPPLLAR
jgi:HAD superfamily hydrolase (TIGR01549 family)